MEATVGWLFEIVVMGAIGLISWSLKELYNRIKSDREETREKINELENKIEINSEKTENKIYRVESRLADYVTKEDFYREINKLDMKLDTIQERITEISNGIAALAGKGE